MKLGELIYKEEYILSECDPECEINSVCIDISESKDGALLIIANAQHIPDFDEGDRPSAVICSLDASIPDHISAIRVDDPRAALSFVCFRFYSPKLSGVKLIGITGTNGKSSTAMFIKKILTDAGMRPGYIGTGKIETPSGSIAPSDYSMTTPDPPLLYQKMREMTDMGCDVIIMEVSSHALALSKLLPLNFDYGVFTSFSSDHIDFHKTKEEYLKAKLGLFKICDTAVFNIDDEAVRTASQNRRGRKIDIGVLYGGDYRATDIEDNGFNGISYLFRGRKFIFRMRLKTAGIYNVYNSLLASAVCIDMGVAPCVVRESLSSLCVLPGRYEIIKGEVTAVIDYAHTDTAFESFLHSLRDAAGRSGHITVLFGCGGKRDRSKRPKMAASAEKYADKIIVTSDNSRDEDPMNIISDIIRGFGKKTFEVNEDRESAIKDAIISAPHGGVVAVIGKGCERYNIDAVGYHYFNEREIIEKAMRERNNENKA